MNIIVNLIGGFLIVFVCWFFFSKKKSEGVYAEGEVTILVQGGYRPDAVKIKKGKIIYEKRVKKSKSQSKNYQRKIKPVWNYPVFEIRKNGKRNPDNCKSN